MNLHTFFKDLWKTEKIKKHRKLMLPGMGPEYASSIKAKEAIGGAMSVKMADSPSPIFVNQSPYYSF